MITKLGVFCLVLATVSPSLAAGTTRCGEIRAELTKKPPNTAPESISLLPISPAASTRGTSAATHVRWAHPPHTLYRLVWDYAGFSDFVPRVRQSTVLDQQERTVWVYQRLGFPPPVRDRHYVLESTTHDLQIPHAYALDWRLSRRHRPVLDRERAIVPSHFSGCWDIRPAAAGGLDAIYFIHLDPAGRLPKWLVTTAVNRYLKALMTALQTHLAQTSSPLE